jgi:DNA-binding NtrC family response regulator
VSNLARPDQELGLVVEDEAELRELIADSLTKAGYAIRTSANGQEAMKVIEEDGAQLSFVVSDLLMPRMDGIELLKWFRGRGESMVFVIMSGNLNAPKVQELAKAGADGILSKPFSRETLVNELKLARGRNAIQRLNSGTKKAV